MADCEPLRCMETDETLTRFGSTVHYTVLVAHLYITYDTGGLTEIQCCQVENQHRYSPEGCRHLHFLD
jgi:hypothetical protein